MCFFGDVLWSLDFGYNVFVLGIDEEFVIECLFVSGWIVGECNIGG